VRVSSHFLVVAVILSLFYQGDLRRFWRRWSGRLGKWSRCRGASFRIRHEVRLSSRITQANDSLYSRTCRILRIQPSTLWPCEYPSDISDTHGRSTWKLAPRHLLHLPRRPDHLLLWPIYDFLNFGWIALNAIFGDYMTDVLHLFLEERAFLWWEFQAGTKMASWECALTSDSWTHIPSKIPTLYLGVKKYLKPLLYRIRHEVRLSSRIT
jgi:hypothetical protein